MFESTAGRLQRNIKFTFGQYTCICRQVCWERGNIHCVRPLGRMHTILVILILVHTILIQILVSRVLSIG